MSPKWWRSSRQIAFFAKSGKPDYLPPHRISTRRHLPTRWRLRLLQREWRHRQRVFGCTETLMVGVAVIFAPTCPPSGSISSDPGLRTISVRTIREIRPRIGSGSFPAGADLLVEEANQKRHDGSRLTRRTSARRLTSQPHRSAAAAAARSP